MTLQKITINKITRTWMTDILSKIKEDVDTLTADYSRLKRDEHLAYELLTNILKKNNKVFAHHSPKHQYNFCVTKGQAWFIVYWYGARKSVSQESPMRYLVNQLHQQII